MTKGKEDRGRQSIVEQEFFTEETSRETKEDKKETAQSQVVERAESWWNKIFYPRNKRGDNEDRERSL